MDKVTYSFVKDEGNFVFRSKVNSFNLDHVTDKDVSSFYTSFSNYAYFDTGLLPLDGTGLLGIRKAGDHTQVIYQHKPGMYYVNWGAYERDYDAVKFYFAQPYRIVIIDFLDNNLLGARTFYTVEPATHSGVQLYHVNLPNINCKGYRGNAVGWICLYHNDDWSNLPFNERLNRALERCSGVEVYNDANMSETDGPRFYQEKEMPLYTWSPSKWQQKSIEEGWEWTLDSSNWIPIQVKDKNKQDAHRDGGIPLTLLDAITGDYQAYYTDSYLPKPINLITREDAELPKGKVMNWFVQSYNNSETTFTGIDPYNKSSEIRKNISITPVASLFDDEEEDEDDQMVTCPLTGNMISQDDCGDHDYIIYQKNSDSSTSVCSACIEQDNIVWIDNAQKYYDISDCPEEILYHDPMNGRYYDLTLMNENLYIVCDSCESLHVSLSSEKLLVNVWPHKDNGETACSRCIDSDHLPCGVCGATTPTPYSAYYNPSIIKTEEDNQLTVYCNCCTELSGLFNKDDVSQPVGGVDIDDQPF